MLYLDTSALIKRYIREPGSDSIRKKIEAEEAGGGLAFTPMLTFAEVHAALTQRRKDRSLSKRGFENSRQLFETDWAVTLSPIALDAGVLLIVRDVVGLGLKGADAVHLASALWLRDSVALGALPNAAGQAVVFATSDKRLARAAQAKKLVTFIPQDHP